MLKTEVQSRLNLWPRPPLQTLTPRSQLSFRRPTKHVDTTNKSQDWGLSVSRIWLILGDSNLAKISPYSHEHLQIESYPGASFKHAKHSKQLIRKAVVATDFEQVVLSFGINNRSARKRRATLHYLLAWLKLQMRNSHGQRSGFPSWISPDSCRQRNNKTWNFSIITSKNNDSSIGPPPIARLFSTLPDWVHWTKATAKNIVP